MKIMLFSILEQKSSTSGEPLEKLIKVWEITEGVGLVKKENNPMCLESKNLKKIFTLDTLSDVPSGKVFKQVFTVTCIIEEGELSRIISGLKSDDSAIYLMTRTTLLNYNNEN